VSDGESDRESDDVTYVKGGVLEAVTTTRLAVINSHCYGHPA